MGQLKTEVRLSTATPSIILIEISIMKSYEINGFLFYWFLSKSKKEIISLYRTHSVKLYKVFHYVGTPPPPPPLSVKKWPTSHPHQYSVPHQYVNWRRGVFY